MKRPLRILIAPYRDLPSIAWLIALGEFVSRGGSGALGYLSLFLLARYNYSASIIGEIVSSAGIGALLGSFLGGWLCDKIGPKKIIVTSQLILAILYLFMPFISNHFLIILVVFLIGTVEYAVRPTLSIVMLDSVDNKVRAQSNALRRLGINLGAATGTAIGGFILMIQIDWIYYYATISSICAALLFTRILPPGLRSAGGGSSTKDLGAGILSPLRDRIFLFVLLGGTITGFIFFQEYATYKLYLSQAYTLGTATIGLICAFNGFIIVLFELPIIHALRHIKASHLCIAGGLLYGIGFGMLPLSNHVLWAWLSLVIWTLGEILSAPTSLAIAQEQASKSASPGSYMGLFTASLAAPGIFAPALGGWLYDIDNGLTLWIFCFVAGIFSAFLFWKAGRHLLNAAHSSKIE